jgi:hypothetical protein
MTMKTLGLIFTRNNMTFAKGDPRINRNGRPREEDKGVRPTQRSQRDKELLMLLRKIRPHVAESINSAASIMRNDKAADASRLKACTILMDNYRRLVLDLYDGEDEESAEEIQQQNVPVFSLRVIDGDEQGD